MPPRVRRRQVATGRLGRTLADIRRRSELTQAEVARRMGTTQTAIARLERGQQSPTVATLQGFARATGYCFELGFVRSGANGDTGCILVVDDGP